MSGTTPLLAGGPAPATYTASETIDKLVTANISKFPLQDGTEMSIEGSSLKVRGETIPFSDIAGASTNGVKLTVHLFELVKKKRKRRNVFLVFEKSDNAAAARKSLINALDGRELGTAIPRRNLLVLVNPFSGTRKAVKVWNSVKDFLSMRGATLEVIVTDHAGHGIELAKGIALQQYDGLVVVSGDGLLHEVYQGLMQHADAASAVKIPVGVIPGGTGNAIAYSMCHYAQEPYSAAACAFLILQGDVTPFDLAEISQQGTDKKFWSFLGLYWAYVADVDLESEVCRYQGRLSYRLGDGEMQSTEGTFTWLTAVNVTYIDESSHISAHIRPNSGYWDIQINRNPGKCKFLCGLLDLDSTEPMPGAEIIRASEFTLEPIPRTSHSPGHLDVDGEEIPYKPTTVKVHQGLARIMGRCTLPHPSESQRPQIEAKSTDGVISSQPQPQATNVVVKIANV